jgi:hypothetical protein
MRPCWCHLPDQSSHCTTGWLHPTFLIRREVLLDMLLSLSAPILWTSFRLLLLHGLFAHFASRYLVLPWPFHSDSSIFFSLSNLFYFNIIVFSAVIFHLLLSPSFDIPHLFCKFRHLKAFHEYCVVHLNPRNETTRWDAKVCSDRFLRLLYEAYSKDSRASLLCTPYPSLSS